MNDCANISHSIDNSSVRRRSVPNPLSPIPSWFQLDKPMCTFTDIVACGFSRSPSSSSSSNACARHERIMIQERSKDRPSNPCSPQKHVSYFRLAAVCHTVSDQETLCRRFDVLEDHGQRCVAAAATSASSLGRMRTRSERAHGSERVQVRCRTRI